MGQGLPRESSAKYGTASAFLLAAAVFALLWVLNIRYRQIYVPTGNDLTALVDGLLMLPDAHWEDWFTQGHSHFFDTYPEWPLNETPFARPVFQFTIYMAHFFFGEDWAAYLVINYVGLAGVAAISFSIAHRALGLSYDVSVLTAILTILSPSVSHFSIWEIGYASESLSAAFVGAGFLSVLIRRDILCATFLALALLMKETSAWASFAAAATVLLRPADGDSARRRMRDAAFMLSPIALWMAFRFAFYGGIGGSYATAGYVPFTNFLSQLAWKVTHINRTFVSQATIFPEGVRGAIDRAFITVADILLALPLLLWGCDSLISVCQKLRDVRQREWPTADPTLLVSLWAALGFGFYLALALTSLRFSASAVMFAWPAMASAVVGRRIKALRIGLVAYCLLTTPRALHLVEEWNSLGEGSSAAQIFSSIASMEEALRQTPTGVSQIYVLSAGGLVLASPDYVAAFLGVSAKIVRVADVQSLCEWKRFDALDHLVADGVVTIRAELPDCARFQFRLAGAGSAAVSNGRIERNPTMVYELPDAQALPRADPLEPTLQIGRRMTVAIRRSGTARFLIEGGDSDGGILRFDVP